MTPDLTTDSAAQDTIDPNAFAYAYLEQGEYWYPDGRPRVAIADMGESWRDNAVRWLERHAETWLLRYELGELAHFATPRYAVVLTEDSERLGRRMSEFDLMSDGALDAYDGVTEERSADPITWIRSTSLYRALIAAGVS